MLFSQQFFYLLIGLGVLFGLPAFWLFTSAMWPRMTTKAREVASRGLLVNFLLGLPALGMIIVMIIPIGRKGGQVGGLLSVGLAGIFAMWSLAGLAGLASHVGSRLWPAWTGDDAWRALWRGGMVVAGTLAIPFIGWYVLLAVVLVIGLGMRVRMWFTPVPQPQTQALPENAGAATPALSPAGV